ncbi:MAG: hypothetical protein CM1200mP14_06770 [Gammaproteobacteria bacterium]|nr:MAG: hypothetical protein CM1200mP14_06770 [Gammaproteobacteria bacterium]
MKGDLETVRGLLRQGADVNGAQGDGMTALHWAAERAQLEMVEVLLYAGAELMQLPYRSVHSSTSGKQSRK